ncbi:hypothetical protein K504DRAFT_508764 [Pleomassaria siparia CBS 279.74]|uniref:Uncharacterized protein n=1 Tax=Pleomassaria siparia CBS 279.74 TaxID=1314801 RepID=A0A6G1JPV3_9PLEO|nr:hypothetical protein K504DRAFT_508764 [Pleomassaria siparia CBS 279.74]
MAYVWLWDQEQSPRITRSLAVSQRSIRGINDIHNVARVLIWQTLPSLDPLTRPKPLSSVVFIDTHSFCRFSSSQPISTHSLHSSVIVIPVTAAAALTLIVVVAVALTAATIHIFPSASPGEHGVKRETLQHTIPGPTHHPNVKRFQVGSRGHR